MSEVEVTIPVKQSINVRANRARFKVESREEKECKLAINDLKHDRCKYLDFSGLYVGMLIGVAKVTYQDTNNVETTDICYIILDSNREIKAVEVNTKYTKLDNIPNDFSVLDYLYKHDRQALIDRINYLLNESGKYEHINLIAPLGIKTANKKNYTKKYKGQKHYKNHRSKNSYKKY